MTTQEIKDTLPTLKINAGKNLYDAQISGRNNRFATVSFRTNDGIQASYEFSWETITRCYNTNRPLQA